MKITDIKTFMVDFGASNYVFVKIYTDEGIEGVGEATLEGLGEDQRAELLALFPDLAQSGAYPAARITLKGREAKVLLSA